MDNNNQPNGRVSLTNQIMISQDNPLQVIPEVVNHASSSSERKTPPPPYTEVPQKEGSLSENSNKCHTEFHRTIISVPSEESTYTVPKDVSEGLPNPVFTNTRNPDGEESDTDRNKVLAVVASNSNETSNVVPTNASFTSLNSYEKQYASQTALYCKDKDEDYSFDTEKGKPSSGGMASSKDTMSKKKGKKEEKEYIGMKKYLGLMLTLSASFCFSVVVLFVKVLKDYGFDAYGASFWRYTGTVIPTIPLLFFYECGPGTKKQSSVFESVWPVFKNENWKTWIGLISRGIIGSTSVILRYYALKYLTIGDTSVITYSTPVLVTILAHIFLGEKSGFFQIIIAFITLFGVIIVTKPPLLTGASEFDTDTLIGTGLACGSLFCSALIVIITRKIREVHFTVMTLVFGVIGVAQALILIYFLGDFNLPKELTDTLLIAGVAALSFVGQMSIILALKFEQAGPVALIRSCDVLFGFLFQYVFLHVAPDIYSAAGAVIVLTGVLSTGFRKWLKMLPEDDSRRKTWWFILK